MNNRVTPERLIYGRKILAKCPRCGGLGTWRDVAKKGWCRSCGRRLLRARRDDNYAATRTDFDFAYADQLLGDMQNRLARAELVEHYWPNQLTHHDGAE